jgi:hypothetical protein
MTYVRLGAPSTKQILLIVFGSLGSALLLMILACGGIIYWRMRSVTPIEVEVETAADAYMRDLRAGHFQAAYHRMTSAFRARRDFQNFERQVAQFPAFTSYTSLTRGSIHFNTTPTTVPTAMVSYKAVSPRQSLSFNVVLMKENGRWLVEKISP